MIKIQDVIDSCVKDVEDEIYKRVADELYRRFGEVATITELDYKPNYDEIIVDNEVLKQYIKQFKDTFNDIKIR